MVRRSRWRRWVFRGAVGLVVIWALKLTIEDASWRAVADRRWSVTFLAFTRAELERMAPGALAGLADADLYDVRYVSWERGLPGLTERGVRLGIHQIQAEKPFNPEVFDRPSALSEDERAWVQKAAAAGGEYVERYPGAYWPNLADGLLVEAPRKCVPAGIVVLLGFGVRWAWREVEARSVLKPYRTCRKCGYSCLGIPSKRCPECGELVGG